MTAAEHLNLALLALTEAGRVPPCGEPDAPDPCSEDHDQRAQAAARCARCPIARQCEAAADELRVSWGVWAGVDRSQRTNTARKKKTA